MILKPIARIETDFPTKFGIPRQSGLVSDLIGKIIFENEYRNPDALRGLEGFSHLWIIWGFNGEFASASDNDTNSWSPTVRPPRLGGNTRVGVFASRSPNRPNPIGLSCVKIHSIEKDPKHGTVIYVTGIDMLNNTPIYDIKPYLPHIDAIPDAVGSYSTDAAGYKLSVICPSHILELIPEEKRNALVSLLENDPRPSYHSDETREYGFTFAGFEVCFKVKNNDLTVTDIKRALTQ